MGQTLTNGVYLPDEGERNCYSGLAANWQLLDGAVGTVAEHTSQIAGKAPAVHTHTKADITDLLNSNFIPSANNSYDLGSSSYQWNNLYAKNYYYNSVEFQEKFATLDTVQTISERKNLKQYWHLMAANLKAGAGETYGRTGYSFIYTDKNDAEMGDVTLYKNSNAARTFIRIRGGDYYTNGVPDAEGTLIQSALFIGTKADSTRFISCGTGAMYPENDNATDLGTSTNRWKTLNGINPGALSLPDYDKCVDKTSEIPVASLDGNTEIDINDYFPNLTGWINIVISDTSGNFIRAVQGKAGTATSFNNSRSFHAGSTGGGFITLFMPIVAGTWKTMKIQASSVTQFRFYPCLGNV